MTVPPESLPPRPSLAAAVVGAVRMAAAAVLLVVGTVAVFAAWPLPSGGRLRVTDRLAQRLARALLAVAGVERRSSGVAEIAGHPGFVFFNHVSYLDPLVLVAATPMRFLATAGVRRLPFVGWIATALGTLYVHRERDESRAAARDALADAVRQSPVPIALAPEGRIGPGPGVLPLRHGAFEVAADARSPVRLVALRFDPPAHAVWQDGEWLPRAFWRLCARTGPLTASLAVLDELEAGAHADAPRQASRAEAVFNRSLRRAA